MKTVPHAGVANGGGVAARFAAFPRLRARLRRDRASRPSRQPAGITTGSRARRLSVREAGATGRRAVRDPLLLLSPTRVQRTRAVAGLSLAVVGQLAVALLTYLAPSPVAGLPAFGCVLVLVASALIGGLLAAAAASVAGSLVLVSLLVQPGAALGADADSLFALATFAFAAVAIIGLLARREAARDALESSEQRHRTVVEELPIAIYTARIADSRLDYVSPQIERLFDMTAEQALDVGDFWTPRLHELDRERVLRKWRAWCADPAAAPFRCTYQLLTESGRVVWVNDVTILLGDPSDKAPSFQRNLFDVTELHELEELVRQLLPFAPSSASDRRATDLDTSVAESPAGAVSPRGRARLLSAIRREADAEGAATSQFVRCLSCGELYRRPAPPGSTARSCCPRCDYVGWITVE